MVTGIQAVYYNIQAPSCNHCCSGKAISITCYDCVFVALGIQHAMGMRYDIICCLTGSSIFFYHDFQKNKLFNIKCVFSFQLQRPKFVFYSGKKWVMRYDQNNTGCPKKIVPFFFPPRCPVFGEWCKLHWLLLDTPSFDWNTCRSRGHNIFKMAPTKQQKAFCAVEYAKTT